MDTEDYKHGYICGLIELSGSFIIQKMEDYKNPHGNDMIQRNAYQFRVEISVKHDSYETLQKIKEYLNLGMIYKFNEYSRYSIFKREEIEKFIKFLGINPFHGKKRKNYLNFKNMYETYIRYCKGKGTSISSIHMGEVDEKYEKFKSDVNVNNKSKLDKEKTPNISIWLDL